MCGRIVLHTPPLQLALRLGMSREDLEERWADPNYWLPSWNVGPMRRILGIRADDDGHRQLDDYRWGLVPSWAKDPKIGNRAFNARAETVATKPMFRSAFKKQRILVPVDAFYEWKKLDPKTKQPYAFTRADGEPIVFAGLREWHAPFEEGGPELRTATIITTEAGPDMPIHDRQPVVLEPETWEMWLDPANDDVGELESLLRPTEAGTLVHYPVSRDVGNVRNDGPALVEELVSGS